MLIVPACCCTAVVLRAADVFWEYSQDTQVWEPVTAEAMQYRLSKLDQELILASRMNSTEPTCTSSWPNRNSRGMPSNSSTMDHGLSVLWFKSVFGISDSGSVFERFWNEQTWVYVNHQSAQFSAAAITAFAGRLYVSARDGTVWERRRVGQELQWVDAEVPAASRVASSPRMDPDGDLWFVSESGDLLQCERPNQVPQSKSSTCGDIQCASDHDARNDDASDEIPVVCKDWVNHRKPFGSCLVSVVDASTFQPNTIFVVTSDEQLLQYDLGLQEWADLGRPTWTGLGPAEGVSVVNEETGDRSLFLLSTQGTLVELFYHGGSNGKVDDEAQASADGTAVNAAGAHQLGDGSEQWQWFDHGCPDGDRVVGPPGGLINMRSLFMVSENGTVYVAVNVVWSGYLPSRQMSPMRSQ